MLKEGRFPFGDRPFNHCCSQPFIKSIDVKIKHTLEFLVCYFSGHDFVVSPETTQQPLCRHCDHPYAETLRDKRWRWRQKSIQISSDVSLSQALTTKPREPVGVRR